MKINSKIKNSLIALGVAIIVGAIAKLQTWVDTFFEEKEEGNHTPFYERDYLPHKIEMVNKIANIEDELVKREERILDLEKYIAQEKHDFALAAAIEEEKKKLQQQYHSRQPQRIFQDYKGIDLYRDRITGTVTYKDPYDHDNHRQTKFEGGDIQWYFYLDKLSGKWMRCLTAKKISELRAKGEFN